MVAGLQQDRGMPNKGHTVNIYKRVHIDGKQDEIDKTQNATGQLRTQIAKLPKPTKRRFPKAELLNTICSPDLCEYLRMRYMLISSL